jgi:hypothetical protein
MYKAAMLGLQTAVTEGDLRVIHLLHWAGLWERVDIETLVWAIKNASKDRLNVLDEITRLWFEKHAMEIQEQFPIDKALAEMQDHAVAESDEETLSFVKAVKEWFGIRG